MAEVQELGREEGIIRLENREVGCQAGPSKHKVDCKPDAFKYPPQIVHCLT